MRYTKEQVDTYFKKLEEPVQDAILATETNDTLQEIGKRYELHIDTMGGVVQEAVYVMVGLESPSAFVENLRKHTNVPEEKVDGVAKAVNEQIFQKIRTALKEQSSKPETDTSPAESRGAQAQGSADVPVAVDQSGKQSTPPPSAGPAETTAPVSPSPQTETTGAGSTESPAVQRPETGADTPTPTAVAPEPSTQTPQPPTPATPTPAAVPTESVAAQKLGGKMQTHVETQNVKNINQTGTAPEKKKREYTDDPYLEPIEPKDTSLPENR